MEKTDQVTIEIDKGKRINRIRIRGDKDDVTKAFEKITNIFHEAGRLAQQEMEAKLIAKEVMINLNTHTFDICNTFSRKPKCRNRNHVTFLELGCDLTGGRRLDHRFLF